MFEFYLFVALFFSISEKQLMINAIDDCNTFGTMVIDGQHQFDFNF